MRIKSEPARSQLYDTLPPKRPREAAFLMVSKIRVEQLKLAGSTNFPPLNAQACERTDLLMCRNRRTKLLFGNGRLYQEPTLLPIS